MNYFDKNNYTFERNLVGELNTKSIYRQNYLMIQSYFELMNIEGNEEESRLVRNKLFYNDSSIVSIIDYILERVYNQIETFNKMSCTLVNIIMDKEKNIHFCFKINSDNKYLKIRDVCADIIFDSHHNIFIYIDNENNRDSIIKFSKFNEIKNNIDFILSTIQFYK